MGAVPIFPERTEPMRDSLARRSILKAALGSLGVLGAGSLARAEDRPPPSGGAPLISPREKLAITKLETFLVKPRLLFLKVHTNAGIVGLGEPILEGRALPCA